MNEGGDWKFMESPAIQSDAKVVPEAAVESSPAEGVEGIQELLLDELRDILHADEAVDQGAA